MEDLHLSFIDSVDLQRGGPGRVQCMRYALAQCRADALAQKDLDLGRLDRLVDHQQRWKNLN